MLSNFAKIVKTGEKSKQKSCFFAFIVAESVIVDTKTIKLLLSSFILGDKSN